VTDLTSGQVLIGTFTIVQDTNGSDIMTIVPTDAKITGPFKGICSTGFATDYYIYGGTPPYRVTSTFPDSITLVNSVVNTNGGFFRAITNGSCVDPLTFSILDATGRQTTATLHNVEGTEGSPGGHAGSAGRRSCFLHRRRHAPARRSVSSSSAAHRPTTSARRPGIATPQTVSTNGGSRWSPAC
jgi:hypothetical protein